MKKKLGLKDFKSAADFRDYMVAKSCTLHHHIVMEINDFFDRNGDATEAA